MSKCKSNATKREINKLRKALRDLLEYTGGSDLVASQPHHPIAKAFQALNREAVRGK